VYRIGIDIGGTFTDFAAVDESGSVVFAKYPSTPRRPLDRSNGRACSIGKRVNVDARSTASKDRLNSSRYDGGYKRAP
jgi:N-methylhydantoinase A/oxoprolinase/acetone carboxylase beta subunit